MQKLRNVLILALLHCSFLVTTYAFQQVKVVTPIRPRVTPEAFTPLQRQCDRQRRSPALDPNREHRSSLYAFGGGGFGNFNVNPPIETKKDILQRIQLIVTGTLRQMASGFISGYLAGSFWSLLNGPSLSGVNRELVWGLDFGILTAIFSATNSVTQLILDLPRKGKDKNDDSKKRQQKASLWSVVIRNMILALYFARDGGLAKMARLAFLYGGASYYFVSQKQKRDAVRMKMFSQNGMGGMPGGMGGMGGMPGGMGGMGSQQAMSQQAMMQQLMQQLASQQATKNPMGTPPPRPPTSSRSSSAPPGPAATKSTPSPSSPKKQEKPKGDIVDVEFEIVDNEDLQ